MKALIELLGKSPHATVQYYEGGRIKECLFSRLAEDVERRVIQLRDLGLDARSKVGLLAENCYEWVVHDLALISIDAISYCFPKEPYESIDLSELVEPYDLDALVTSDSLYEKFYEHDFPVISFSRQTWNKKGLIPRDPTSEADDAVRVNKEVYTVVFSSGSSGRTKALLISKSGTMRLIEGFGDHYDFRSDDAILAFLPLSAFQQRWMVYTAIRYGFNMQLVDPIYLFKAFKEMAPTIFGAPPLFYENVEDRIRGLPNWKFSLMYHLAGLLRALPRSLRRRLQHVFFRELYESLGGRVRLMLTGGAPTKERTIRLLRRFGLPVYEGYGLTETGYISINLPGRDRIGSVGRPLLPDTVSISEQGEVVTRWDKPLSLGYLNMSAAENSKTYVDEHMILTGDIGHIDSDGFLFITGRIKEILVSRGGEKVHPEQLEKELESLPDVDRAVVFPTSGDDGVSVVIAIKDIDRLNAIDEIKKALFATSQRAPKGLNIKHYCFTDEKFTIENGFLTRNLKVNRRVIQAHFQGLCAPLVA